MTEPEDTLTKHGIKRVFVVLLILRILWEVGMQQPQSEVVAFEPAMATAKAEDIATQAEETQNTLHSLRLSLP